MEVKAPPQQGDGNAPRQPQQGEGHTSRQRAELGYEFRSNQMSLANLPIDLVLVRHGESEGNIVKDRGDLTVWDGPFGGRHTSKYRLTDRGRAQAQQAGQWLRSEFGTTIDVYFTSEYVRAIETAAHLGLPGAIWTMDRYLRERDNGIFSGKPSTSPNAAAEAAEEKRRRARDLFFYSPPGGESIANACQRVDLFLQHLAESCSGLRVLAIVHRNVMQSFRIVLESIPQLKFDQVFVHDPEGELDNCHVLWYSRRNPFTREVHSRIQWVRSVLPFKQVDKGWRQIFRPRFSNTELMQLVSRIPQIVNNTREEMDEYKRGTSQPCVSPAPERETDEPTEETPSTTPTLPSVTPIAIQERLVQQHLVAPAAPSPSTTITTTPQ